MESGTASTGPELLVELRRASPVPLRAQLEDGMRTAVRAGRLGAGTRLPASRTLARDLAVSRRLVVEAYAQLVAEGYLESRTGAGTFVRADMAAAVPEAAAVAPPRAPTYDFFPGAPDLAGFPRTVWARCLRDALRDLPDRALGYPDARGAAELRAELAAYLSRARGVVADPERIVVCSGASQALGLLATVLGTGSRIAVEDPYLPDHRTILQRAGAEVIPVPVDEHGLRTGALEAAAPDAALVTPAHQAPTGVAMTPARRAGLIEWATEGRTVIEDDYDAEFRYDRIPLAALQGLAPERVVYMGSASKTLAPALRLAWLVLPAGLVEPTVEAKRLADHGSPTIDQAALALFIAGGHLDRHLRSARRRYRARRAALGAALEARMPGARLEGLAAGLHAVVRLPEVVDGGRLMREAWKRDVGVYPLGFAYAQIRHQSIGVVLGYAGLTEPAIDEGVARFAAALAAVAAGPARPSIA